MKTILMMAITLDGMIAKDPHHFPDWSGRADKRFFARETRRAGVVIMGSKTFDTIARPLPGRRNVVLSRDPRRRSRPPELVFTDRRPDALLKELERDGYTEAVLAGGARINTLFAAKGLIDEIIVTVAPKTFGTGISLFSDATPLELTLVEVLRLDDQCIALHYRVVGAGHQSLTSRLDERGRTAGTGADREPP